MSLLVPLDVRAGRHGDVTSCPTRIVFIERRCSRQSYTSSGWMRNVKSEDRFCLEEECQRSRMSDLCMGRCILSVRWRPTYITYRVDPWIRTSIFFGKVTYYSERYVDWWDRFNGCLWILYTASSAPTVVLRLTLGTLVQYLCTVKSTSAGREWEDQQTILVVVQVQVACCHKTHANSMHIH